MAPYGRVIARFKGFQAGYRVKGTVEFVPKNWGAGSGSIFAPAPVIGDRPGGYPFIWKS